MNACKDYGYAWGAAGKELLACSIDGTNNPAAMPLSKLRCAIPIAQAIALNFEYKEALNAMAAATNTLLEDDECLQLCTSLVAADSREEHRWWPMKNQQGQRWLCPKCVNNMWRTAAKAANIDAPKDVK